MKDRISTYPGRVRLTPVSGNIYDLEMADDPVQEGTALNKANLMTDATAALLSLSGDPSVNDALATLSARAKIASGSYVGTGTYGSSNPNVLTFNFVPKFVVIADAYGSGSGDDNKCAITWMHGCGIGFAADRVNNSVNHLTWDDTNKKLTWYCSDDYGGESAFAQLNVSGDTYYWVAIGGGGNT